VYAARCRIPLLRQELFEHKRKERRRHRLSTL
jgi:hypothetical protein